MTAAPPSGHRPALDGVRAVAVLAVIDYHAGSLLGGGFLGVDIFFVLSGYLITALLLGEQTRSGSISLPSFWARRARRLLPALLIVVVVIAIKVDHDNMVATFGARRDDLISSIFYFANWHFIGVGQSYFALYQGVSPLQHMWSLSIEEQFYVVWPFLMIGAGWLLRGRRLALSALMVGGAVASAVVMAVLYKPINPTRAYIGTDSHASGLMIGAALAALLAARPQILENLRLRRAGSLGWPLMAVLIGVALVAMDDHGSFYYRGGSLAFALVVAAAIAQIEMQPRSVPGRLLSLKPVAWVGTISYGLYLWHWPLITWFSTSTSITGARDRQIVEIGLTFVIATLSFYLVERPIRTGAVPWLRRSARKLAVILGVAAAAAVAVSVNATEIPPTPVAQQLTDYGGRDCPAGSPTVGQGYVWCDRAQPRAGLPTVAVVGDSTSIALDYAMQAYVNRHGWGYIEAGQNGCSILPLSFPGVVDDPPSLTKAGQCVAVVPKILSAIRERYHPDLWLVSDRWMTYPLQQQGGPALQPGTPERDEQVLAAMKARLQSLTADGAKVAVLITPPPGPPVECATSKASQCTVPLFSTADPVTRVARDIDEQAIAAAGPSVAAVDIDDIVCPDDGHCPVTIDDVLVRWDGVHFTAKFGTTLVPLIMDRVLKELGPLG